MTQSLAVDNNQKRDGHAQSASRCTQNIVVVSDLIFFFFNGVPKFPSLNFPSYLSCAHKFAREVIWVCARVRVLKLDEIVEIAFLFGNLLLVSVLAS